METEEGTKWIYQGIEGTYYPCWVLPDSFVESLLQELSGILARYKIPFKLKRTLKY